MPANLGNSAMATGLENVSFHSNPKERQCQRCSNYHTIALISHANKVMLKILQARLQQYVNHELPDVQAGFRKAEKPEIKLATSTGSLKKQESSRKMKNIYICFIDYAKAFDCVDHNKLWNILKEMGIPDHLTCLLRNLYAGQEATVRTGHGTTDWFQIRKGVLQGCILSPWLFNLYAESSGEMLDWMKHKLESRLLGEISVTSDMQMIPPLWQKAKKNERASWWKWKRRVKKLT